MRHRSLEIIRIIGCGMLLSTFALSGGAHAHDAGAVCGQPATAGGHASCERKRVASCQKIADRYRSIAEAYAGKSPLTALSSVPESGVVLIAPVGRSEDGESELTAWATDSSSIQSFGFLDTTAAYFLETAEDTPDLSTTITVATRQGDRISSDCSVAFLFSPVFNEQTPSAWGEECEGEDCQELRHAAFQLAEAAQRSPSRARDELEALLPPQQWSEYRDAVESAPGDPDAAAVPAIPTAPAAQAVKAAARENIAAADADPADITEDKPLLLPYLKGNTVYIASVGHFVAGNKRFADWSVRFESVEHGKRVARARFAVGMSRGPLEGTSVRPLACAANGCPAGPRLAHGMRRGSWISRTPGPTM